MNSGPGATFIIVSGHNDVELSLATVPGPWEQPAAGLWLLFSIPKDLAGVDKGQLCKATWADKPVELAQESLLPLDAQLRGLGLDPATLVGVHVRCSPTERINLAFVGQRTA